MSLGYEVQLDILATVMRKNFRKAFQRASVGGSDARGTKRVASESKQGSQLTDLTRLLDEICWLHFCWMNWCKDCQ